MDIVYKDKSDVYVITLPSGKIHPRPDGKVEIYLDRYDASLIHESHQTTLDLECGHMIDKERLAHKERSPF